ncbi:DUF3558 domain-containing protein [Nocardia nova]|uniref:DUF3558 domain-containing protein n=1 Tax=Nocardia nova TaxID=37330 RepID=UPI0033F55C4B
MRNRRALGAFTIGIALIGGTVACGRADDGTTAASATHAAASGTRAVASPVADQTLWDPCQLPDAAIAAAGADPATKVPKVAGADFPGWNVCTWRANAKWYDFVILSGPPTLQEIQQRDDYTEFTPDAVGPHRAVQFVDKDDPDRLNCYLAVEIPGGSATFRVSTRYSVGKQGDPCVEVHRYANSLGQYLPS